jgi:hypothetical protein
MRSVVYNFRNIPLNSGIDPGFSRHTARRASMTLLGSLNSWVLRASSGMATLILLLPGTKNSRHSGTDWIHKKAHIGPQDNAYGPSKHILKHQDTTAVASGSLHRYFKGSFHVLSIS